MRPSNSLVATIALLWGLAICSPAPIGAVDLTSAGKTFTLEQVAVERKTPWSVAHAIRKTYLKYGVEPPEYVEAAVREIEQSGPGTATVGARPIKGDTEYLIWAKVGNHNLSLDLDTGSADLWVFSTLQPTDQRSGRPINRVYDTSGGRQLQGSTWQIKYGDRSGANGQVYLDKVSIGDLTVSNQAVEAAASVSRTFAKDPSNDGLLGLAFSRLNTIKPKAQLTWFDNIKPKLAAPVFTCSLRKHETGSYDFGYIDKAKYKGEIVWTNVRSPKGFWDFQATGFAIGRGEVKGTTINAVADTGSSLWYLPRAVADAYYREVEGAQFNQMQSGWMFPCGSKLPDMSLVVSGKKVTVPGSNMSYQKLSASTCFGGIQRDTGMPFSIAGDVFLKEMFVVFENAPGGSPRLGFASAASR